jgi:alginate O-acetyltransferase complex protein AlgI
MAFNSLTFLIFVAAVVIVYFLFPKKFQWVVLLAASYLFYLISARTLVIFLLFTTITTFYTGLLLGKLNNKYAEMISRESDTLTKEQKKGYSKENKKKKWMILFVALVVNFGILAFMKYFNFFAINTNAILSLLSFKTFLPTISVLLPLGISFYTFQSTSYVIDVYRGKIQPDKNIAKFALFVSFFPQIVQGPISRYDDLANQLYEPHKFDFTRAKFGAQLILWGLFKKMVIADRAAVIVDFVFKNYMNYEGIPIFMGAMLYTVQVYCDFSGGIDIARGVAQILGINLTNNFKRPLFATSMADFWRRWHITLSSWTRDYIFYPLSLSRTFTKIGRFSRKIFGNYIGKLIPTFLAMTITFLVIGIWHGASWKFIFYGLYNGIFIFSGILFKPLVNFILPKFQIKTDRFSWRLFQIFSTFFLVSIGRYFSRAPSFMVALEMLKRTFSTFNPWVLLDGSLYKLGLDRVEVNFLIIVLVLLIIVDIFQERGYSIRTKISEQNIIFRWLLYFAIIFAILIFGMYGSGYDVTDFIYMGL